MAPRKDAWSFQLTLYKQLFNNNLTPQHRQSKDKSLLLPQIQLTVWKRQKFS